MHRHRRTIWVPQDYTYVHGYDTHPEAGKYGGLYPYQLAMDTITPVLAKLDKTNHEAAVYLYADGFQTAVVIQNGLE